MSVLHPNDALCNPKRHKVHPHPQRVYPWSWLHQLHTSSKLVSLQSFLRDKSALHLRQPEDTLGARRRTLSLHTPSRRRIPAPNSEKEEADQADHRLYGKRRLRVCAHCTENDHNLGTN